MGCAGRAEVGSSRFRFLGVSDDGDGGSDEVDTAVVTLLGEELPNLTTFGLEEDWLVESSKLELRPSWITFGLEDESSSGTGLDGSVYTAIFGLEVSPRVIKFGLDGAGSRAARDRKEELEETFWTVAIASANEGRRAKSSEEVLCSASHAYGP